MEENIVKVSVIIPTYNDGDMLREALLSITSSDYPIWEVIVVDDGSLIKSSYEIYLDLKSSFPFELKYFYKENGGASSARNHGLRMSSGDWILFLDSDDFFISNSISSKINAVRTCGLLNIAGCYGSFIWDKTGEIQVFVETKVPVKRNWIGVLGRSPGGAPSYIFSKQVLVDVGGFDESLRFNEDFDLILRIISAKYFLIGISLPGFIRRTRSNSLSRSNMSQSLRGERIFLVKAQKDNLLGSFEIIKRFAINIIRTLILSVRF